MKARNQALAIDLYKRRSLVCEAALMTVSSERFGCVAARSDNHIFKLRI
ncbi:hypothetical protein [Fischerella sp. PCC 9605]